MLHGGMSPVEPQCYGHGHHLLEGQFAQAVCLLDGLPRVLAAVSGAFDDLSAPKTHGHNAAVVADRRRAVVLADAASSQARFWVRVTKGAFSSALYAALSCFAGQWSVLFW